MFIPKLIVTDLDGTALLNDKTISQATLDTFQKIHLKKIPVAIATARYIQGAKPYALALKADYQILTDGTLVYHKNQLIYSNAMSVETTNKLLQAIAKTGYTSHIAIPTTQGIFRYPNGNFDISKPFPYGGNKFVVELPSDQIAHTLARECGCSQFHYRGENRYTFFHPTASKLDAISHLAASLNISLADVLVFGDDINDMEMIAGCGMGVAMGNALPQVKSIANAITLTNEQDGLTHFVHNLFMGSDPMNKL